MRQICFTLVRCLCAQTTGHWLIKATNGKETTDRKALHNALQSVHAESRFDSQHTTVSHEQTPVLQEFTSPCEIVHKRSVGLLGLEPRTNGLKVRCSNQPLMTGRCGLSADNPRNSKLSHKVKQSWQMSKNQQKSFCFASYGFEPITRRDTPVRNFALHENLESTRFFFRLRFVVHLF